jgi:hypothetical protein
MRLQVPCRVQHAGPRPWREGTACIDGAQMAKALRDI